MLKGGLETEPLHSILVELGETKATGCLQVNDARGDEGLIYLKDGLVYSVSVSNLRPALGARLVSSGTLTPDALADAIEAQRFELRGWRLGELLVHLGYVEQAVVEQYVDEQVNDGLAALLSWPIGTWKFRNGRRTREDIAPSRTVAELLANAQRRNDEQAALLDAIHGPRAVPTLSTTSDRSGEIPLDPDAWSLLCKIDGTRSITELAHDCGFTLFEAGQVIHSLLTAGLVDIHESIDDLTRPATTHTEADQIAGRAAALIAALSESGPLGEPPESEAVDDVAADGDADPAPLDEDEAAFRREVSRLAAAKELADAFTAAHAEREDTQGDSIDLILVPALEPVPVDAEDAEPVDAEDAEPVTDAEPVAEAAPEPTEPLPGSAELAEPPSDEGELTPAPVLALVPELSEPAELSEHPEPEEPEPEEPEPSEPAEPELTLVPALDPEPAEAALDPEPEPTPDTTASVDDDPRDRYDPAAMASASALLAEFNRLTTSVDETTATQGATVATKAGVLPEASETDADQRETATDEAPVRQSSPGAMADTASLLRELSSLGLDDSAAPTPAPQGVRPPAPAQPKKRKGLFGR